MKVGGSWSQWSLLESSHCIESVLFARMKQHGKYKRDVILGNGALRPHFLWIKIDFHIKIQSCTCHALSRLLKWKKSKLRILIKMKSHYKRLTEINETERNRRHGETKKRLFIANTDRGWDKDEGERPKYTDLNLFANINTNLVELKWKTTATSRRKERNWRYFN